MQQTQILYNTEIPQKDQGMQSQGMKQTAARCVVHSLEKYLPWGGQDVPVDFIDELYDKPLCCVLLRVSRLLMMDFGLNSFLGWLLAVAILSGSNRGHPVSVSTQIRQNDNLCKHWFALIMVFAPATFLDTDFQSLPALEFTIEVLEDF